MTKQITTSFQRGDAAGVSSKQSLIIKNFFLRYGTIVALLVVTLILAFTTPSFMTALNIKSMLAQTAVLGIVAIGLTFVSIPGEMDVSMGSVVTLSGVFAVSMMTKEYGLFAALAAAAAVGIVVGSINGLISIYGHISSLIATLTIGAIIDGVSLLYTGGYRLYKGILPSYRYLGIGEFVNIPVPVIILILVAVLAYLLAHQTVFGRRLFAIGGNTDAAILMGINPKLHSLLSFILCSTAAALAGVIVTARVGTAEPFVRFGYVLDAFAVVFLGTTTSEEGEPHIPGTVLGILIMGVLSNGMTLVGVPFFAQNILKGAIVLITVVVSSIMRQQRK